MIFISEHIAFNKFINQQKDLRDETAKLTAQAVTQVWGDMERFPRLLDVVERFNQNSGTLGGGSANALLLYAQCPNATRLGSFEDWKKEQSFIKRGEKGLKIYVRSPGKEDPKTHRVRYFYNVEHRFDISQVNRTPEPEVVPWSDPIDIIRAISKAGSFGIQYDSSLPDGADAVYIPEIREVRVRDGQDADQMCFSLLTEFCHYAQHKIHGKAYERNDDANFVALCGGYILARRFGVSTEHALFQREAFPEVPEGNIQENYLKAHGYTIHVLNLVDPERSDRYNPFVYLRTDDDVDRMVENFWKATAVQGAQKGEQIWDDMAKELLSALAYYLYYEAPQEEQNFPTIQFLLRNMGLVEGEQDSSPVEQLFSELEQRDPEHIALKHYRAYHSGATKTLQSIQITLLSRLGKFNLESIERLSTTNTDDLGLLTAPEERSVIFAVTPVADSSFNFFVSLLYGQLFEILYEYGNKHGKLKEPMHILMDEFANITLPSGMWCVHQVHM